jgi:hypothetical protein
VQRLLSCLVLISAVAGIAQTPTNGHPLSPSLDRRIELLIRSQFSVRPDYDMTLGARTASDTVGYDNLPVTFSHKGKQTTVDFLISKDGSILERVEKFSTSNNAAMAIDVEKRPVRGDATAKVEIINFDDLQCPYCGMLNNEILPQTMNHYKGLVKIVYRDYPLPGHPWAMRAAIDANCPWHLKAMRPIGPMSITCIATGKTSVGQTPIQPGHLPILTISPALSGSRARSTKRSLRCASKSRMTPR